MSGALNPLLGYAAGALTILSPCVLPLIPLVLGSAAQANKWGPLALAGGLVASFTLAGFALATAGASAGFDGEIVQMVGAAALGVVGLMLLLPQAQHAFENAPPHRFRAGRRRSRRGWRDTGWPVRPGLARCWGWYGAHASGRRWARLRCSRRKVKAWARWRR